MPIDMLLKNTFLALFENCCSRGSLKLNWPTYNKTKSKDQFVLKRANNCRGKKSLLTRGVNLYNTTCMGEARQACKSLRSAGVCAAASKSPWLVGRERTVVKVLINQAVASLIQDNQTTLLWFLSALFNMLCSVRTYICKVKYWETERVQWNGCFILFQTYVQFLNIEIKANKRQTTFISMLRLTVLLWSWCMHIGKKLWTLFRQDVHISKNNENNDSMDW